MPVTPATTPPSARPRSAPRRSPSETSVLRLFGVVLSLLTAMACAPVRPAEATEWSGLFERREGFGWSGGDAAYSVPLPGNRVLWLFGDTYLSGVRAGVRDRIEFRFGNSVAVQENAAAGEAPTPTELKFDWGPAGSNGWLPLDANLFEQPGAPRSAVQARERHLPLLSWPLHGLVVGNDLVLFNMPVTSTDCGQPGPGGVVPGGKEPCGLFPFKVHGTTLTIVRGVDRPYAEWGVRRTAGWDPIRRPRAEFVPHSRSAAALSDSEGLQWGTFLMRDPRDAQTVYVYGHREAKTGGTLVVARVPRVARADDLRDFARWTFWNGHEFQPDPEAAVGIATDSTVEASIVVVPSGGYALVQSGNLFSGEIRVARADALTGPFVNRYLLSLADCPVTGFDPAAKQMTYAAKAHPELSTDAELLLSLVTVPALGQQGAYGNPQHYAPRFLRLPWSEIESYDRSSKERCAGAAE